MTCVFSKEKKNRTEAGERGGRDSKKENRSQITLSLNGGGRWKLEEGKEEE